MLTVVYVRVYKKKALLLFLLSIRDVMLLFARIFCRAVFSRCTPLEARWEGGTCSVLLNEVIKRGTLPGMNAESLAETICVLVSTARSQL